MEHVVVSGKLNCSSEGSYYIDSDDDGGFWLLDIPWLMKQTVDRMLHMRVIISGWADASMIGVSTIVEAE